jgi:UTP--glucose-1-phosphate uridylyltransferase
VERVVIDVDPATRAVLDRFGFDEALFESLRARVAAGTLSPETNLVRGSIEPPTPEDVTRLPAHGEAGYQAARDAGLEALSRSQVAQVILAGGMATRFGGVVKAVLAAVDGRSFLEAKLVQTAALEGRLECRIPVALMTSFATDDAIRAHVAERSLGDPFVFNQFVSPRLEPDGELFRDSEDRASLYAPGHGDLFQALRRSGTLDGLRERGVRVVTVSNVDNLGARVDPVVVGAHLLGGKPLTCEVARKEGDMGGAPVRVDGKLQLVEGPRFPPSFDQGLAPVFNTNTALFDLEALDVDYDLTWLYVEKSAEGRAAVQLERLYHEASALIPAQYLEVPRRGPRGRFSPIKTPADLERAQDELRELVSADPLA